MIKKNKKIFDEISKLSTEQQNQKSINIDKQSTEEILRIINNEDKTVPLAVEKEIPHIVLAVDKVIEALKNGGRLLYFGAGTSGRLGVVDASECPPTFGAPFDLIQGFIAGGNEAMFRAQEGAEDYEENGLKDIVKAEVKENDVVCGLAASRRTPYVIGAIKEAKRRGATTLFITATDRESFNIPEVDIAICPHVGQEVVMGSTRMKSGTAQKLVLNMITTTAFVRMGKTYENMMIDLQLTNNKLVERAKRIIMTITGVDYDEAAEYLIKADGHVKTALVMILADVDYDEAQTRLNAADGFVRKAIFNK